MGERGHVFAVHASEHFIRSYDVFGRVLLPVCYRSADIPDPPSIVDV